MRDSLINPLWVEWEVWKGCSKKARLVTPAPAKPTAPFLDIVEWKVEAFAHPVPISSNLHHACPKRQWVMICLAPFGI